MELRPTQKEAIKWISTRKISLIQGATSFGKTFTTLYYASLRKNFKFIILVHKLGMIKQWEEEQKKIFGKLLPNVKMQAYTTDIEDFECDVLVVDEFHFLKGMGVKYKRAIKINWKQTIWLTATPVEIPSDWYAYFKFMGVMTREEDFLKRYKAYGQHEFQPDIWYPKYINFSKTPYFKCIGLNNNKLLDKDLSKILIKFEVHEIDSTLEDIKWEDYKKIELKCGVVGKVNFYKLFDPETPFNYHNKQILNFFLTREQKLEKIKLIKGKIAIVTKRTVEKEFLLEKLPKSTSKYKEFENGKNNYFIAHETNAEWVGTDGMQKITNQILYFSPPSSYSTLKQTRGRINRTGKNKEAIIYVFISNAYEKQRWKKVISKRRYI